MDTLKNYIQNNSNLLFKPFEKDKDFALFDDRGFWFSDEAQLIYNQVKDQPHLYVAWSSHKDSLCYIGKSFQKGGRWKRQHSYHLGTLAYHLLDTMRKYDQNHSHWIKNWFEINSIQNADNNLKIIRLQKPVYICFIPFKIYSGLDFLTQSNKEIKDINSDLEKKLIWFYGSIGARLLNIQSKQIQKIPKIKTDDMKNSISSDNEIYFENKDKSDCVTFIVAQHDLAHQVANEIDNLPTGPCTIIIKDLANQHTFLYVRQTGNPNRKINKTGRSVSEFFQSPDTNYLNGIHSKSFVLQLEMGKKKIQNALITVCKEAEDNDSFAKNVEIPQPTPNIKDISKISNYLGDINNNFKVVFICSSKKYSKSDLNIGNTSIFFKGTTNTDLNEFKPDDIIPTIFIDQLKTIFNKVNFLSSTTWRDLVELNNRIGNPLLLKNAYLLYSRKYEGPIYKDLFNKYNNRFFILSAGWGLINASFEIPNYDITFNNVGNNQSNNRRIPTDKYQDFNHLGHENSLDDIIFIGSPEYLNLFYNQTKHLKSRKIIFWKKQNTPQKYPAPNDSFTFIKFESENNISWHYELARKYFL